MKRILIALIIIITLLTVSTAFALTPEQRQDIRRLAETWNKIKVSTKAPMTQWLTASNNSRIATCGLYILAMEEYMTMQHS